MARTAVIAGTATAVSNKVSRSQYEKQAAKAEQDAAAQAAFDSQAQLDAMQTQMNARQPAPAPAAPPADDVLGQLQRLADMKTAGLLTDEEFAAAKAKLLS
jgi:hypothetical protein